MAYIYIYTFVISQQYFWHVSLKLFIFYNRFTVCKISEWPTGIRSVSAPLHHCSPLRPSGVLCGSVTRFGGSAHFHGLRHDETRCFSKACATQQGLNITGECRSTEPLRYTRQVFWEIPMVFVPSPGPQFSRLITVFKLRGSANALQSQSSACIFAFFHHAEWMTTTRWWVHPVIRIHLVYPPLRMPVPNKGFFGIPY